MNVYIDTSAVVKMMRWEKETAALEEHINVELERGTRFVSSRLVETELRREAYRLDAIHLSTVLSFDGEITRVLTYDQQLSAAADHEGLVSYQV